MAAEARARTIEVDDSMVFAPSRQRPKGIVHFLGGAFAGAVPHLAYSLLLERLAEGGYTAVATPYPVTFQHLDCARSVHAKFESALTQLRSSHAGGAGRSQGVAAAAWAAPEGLPVHGVGHSNGALLHMLISALGLLGPQPAGGSSTTNSRTTSSSWGSSNGTGPLVVTSPPPPPPPPPPAAAAAVSRASNVLISYNNLQVGTAVPVPLGLLLPAVQQLRGQGRLAAAAREQLAQAAAAAQQLLALSGSAAAAAAPLLPAAGSWGQQQQQLLADLQRLDPALLQLASVFDEVGDGYEDFTPSPAESRQLISSGYSVPSTLLVRFTDDSIDQTPEAAAMLSQQGRPSGATSSAASGPGSGSIAASSAGGSSGSNASSSRRRVSTLVLPGSHVTPCGGDASWQPRGAFGPADVLAQAAKAVVQADTNRLADRILDHLDAHS